MTVMDVLDFDQYRAYWIEERITPRPLAIQLVDQLTGEVPLGNIKITINEQPKLEGIRNLSGYICFFGLEAGLYTVRIDPELYFTEIVTVDTTSAAEANPVVQFQLRPRPVYPFSSLATLARGLVMQGTVPLSGAIIRVSEVSIIPSAGFLYTQTDERGEFVLYFHGIKEKKISIEITKGGQTKNVSATIKENKIEFLGEIPFP